MIGGLNCYVSQSSATPKSVVILCHGFGAPGSDLVPVADEMIHANGAIAEGVQFVFPAAPIEMEFGGDSRAWWPISMSQFEDLAQPEAARRIAEFIPDELESSHQSIVAIIGHFCQQHQLPKNQIIIGGFSQGAMLMTDVFLRSGLELGGLIDWSGCVINQMAWKLALENSKPGNIVQTHGYLDPVLPFKMGTALRDLLQQRHHVDFFAFQGYHQIPLQAIQLSAKLIERLL